MPRSPRADQVKHLQQIARSPEVDAPGGMAHLVLEVLAHSEDEAASQERWGQVMSPGTVTDPCRSPTTGRGTDTRVDRRGRAVVKPMMPAWLTVHPEWR